MTTKKILFLIMLLITVNSWSDVSETTITESAEASSATEVVTESSEEKADEKTEESESSEVANQPVENYVECSDGYMEYIRSLPKNAQQAEFDVWWEYTDNEYRV